MNVEKLKALLAERGWSGYELSKRTTLTSPGIYSILNGESREPRISTMVEIADALGVSLEALR